MAKTKQRSKRNWQHGYSSRQVAKAAHPQLDPTTTIHFADVEQLRPVGFINHPKLEHVLCRLERDGKVCETEHGRGIVVEAPGDVTNHVGWFCYENYPEDHLGFKAEVVQLDRMHKAADLERRLAVCLEDDAFLDRVEALRERRLRTSHQVAIRTYRRTLDPSGNEMRDEDGKLIVESGRVVVGQFSGLRALDHSRFSELADTVAAIALALEKAQKKAEPSARKVDRWVQAFDRLATAEMLADRVEADLDEFMDGSNLELLRFVAHYVGQPSLAFVANAKLTGITGMSESVAVQSAQDWMHALCTRFQCDRFESHGV